MDSKTETIKVGKYRFIITETIAKRDNIVIIHSFKIGGRYDNCITVSYTYNGLQPIHAKIAFIEYKPECSFDIDLERNGGTVIMLKALLKYVYNKIPAVNKFYLDDMSHIDCINEAKTKPLNLAYLSIAYNSCTWYEKHFGAVMSDEMLYSRYKAKLAFLTNPEYKLDFVTFLQIAKPPPSQFDYLQNIYENAKTYRDFFKSIPFNDKCEILQPWLNTFMEYYLNGAFQNNNWVIDVRSPKFNNIVGASRTRTRKQSKDYSSNYRIIMHKIIHHV